MARKKTHFLDVQLFFARQAAIEPARNIREACCGFGHESESGQCLDIASKHMWRLPDKPEVHDGIPEMGVNLAYTHNSQRRKVQKSSVRRFAYRLTKEPQRHPMRRPKHLPNFTDPPLNEVALGVQFAPIPSYSSVNAHGIWELFKADFPTVQEHPQLPPQFETFGGANAQPGFQFHVGAPPVGSRLWFLSKGENHLIQFQSDRLLMNWRKNPNSQPYPRFEGISDALEKNLRVLTSHLASRFDYAIDINQSEVSYINIIPVEDFSKAGSWFSLWNGGALNIEALNTSFNEVIHDRDNKPIARLSHTIQTVFVRDRKDKAFRLSLTFRGKPSGNDVDSAMEFLNAGREAIVARFGEITTSEAHEFWGRQE